MTKLRSSSRIARALHARRLRDRLALRQRRPTGNAGTAGRHQGRDHFTGFTSFTNFTRLGITLAMPRKSSTVKRTATQRRKTATFVSRRAKRTVALGASGHDASFSIYQSLLTDVDERRLRTVLETVRSYIFSTKDDAAALRARNQDRVDTLSALTFADALSSDEAGTFVRRSRPVVNQMVRQGQLLAVPDGLALRFPRWQFDAGCGKSQ